MSILEYEYQDKIVLFGIFKDEVYINTKISKEFDRDVESYLKTKRVKHYIKTIQNIDSFENDLIVERDSETWIHNLLAIDFIKWFNFELSIWCNIKIKEILSKSDSYIKILEEENKTLQKYAKYQDLKILSMFEMRERIFRELRKMDRLNDRTSFI